MNNKVDKKKYINEKNKKNENNINKNIKNNNKKYFYKEINKFNNSLENIKEYIKNKPITSILLSLSIGFILGLIIKKNKNSY